MASAELDPTVRMTEAFARERARADRAEAALAALRTAGEAIAEHIGHEAPAAVKMAFWRALDAAAKEVR